jgi:hypothetical protein
MIRNIPCCITESAETLKPGSGVIARNLSGFLIFLHWYGGCP